MKGNLLGIIGAGIISAVSLINCASFDPGRTGFEAQYRDIQKTMRVLNINDMRFLDQSLRNGFYATVFGAQDLRIAAGIAAGTIKVEKTAKGYSGKGTFSQYLQQNVLDQACEFADRNDDDIVTNKEASDLLYAVYRTATEGRQ